MREKKWRFETFSFYDRTGIEDHLTKMVQAGWLLEKMTGFGWWYRRIEPKKLHFIVTYYPQASAYDPDPSEGELTFQDYCAAAGWHLAASAAQMQVFYHEQDNPVPIETDGPLQVETIHQAMKRTFLPSYVLLLLIGLLNGAFFCTRLWQDPIGVLGSNTNLFNGLSMMLLILLGLVEIIGYITWYRRAKAAAAFSGELVATRGHHRLQIGILFILLTGGAGWLLSLWSGGNTFFAAFGILYVVALIAATSGTRSFLKRKKVAAGASRIATGFVAFAMSFVLIGGSTAFIIRGAMRGWLDEPPVEVYQYQGQAWNVYQDELPLKIEDLMEVSYNEYSYRLTTAKSPFLISYEATQRPRMDALAMPSLEYTITQISSPVLYRFCLNGLLRDYWDEWEVAFGYHLVEQDATPWGAEAAYQLYRNGEPHQRYLVCWPECIVELSCDWPLTPEQMGIAHREMKSICPKG